jgi:hypothetical protein
MPCRADLESAVDRRWTTRNGGERLPRVRFQVTRSMVPAPAMARLRFGRTAPSVKIAPGAPRKR